MKTCEKHAGCLVISYSEKCPICEAKPDLYKQLGESFDLFKMAASLGAQRIKQMEAECQPQQ